MIRHILLIELRPEVSAAEVEGLRQAFDELIAQLPLVRAAVHGPALGLPGSSARPAGYAVALDFETAQDFAAYIEAPVHRQFVERHLAPLRAGAMSAQIQI